jgi:CheY-like chemotaxis protein
VIDDEPMIAEVVRRTLCREHDVLALNAARDALERIRGGAHFDLILCDLMMPQMTGIELHDAIRELDPGLSERMIFLTGSAFTPAARAFLDRVGNQRVEKPFDTQHLRSLVNDRVR